MNLKRRSLLTGLLAVAATVYAIDPAEASIKVIRSRTIGVAGPTVTIASPIANGSPYTASFAPTYRDAYVCMSPTVAQNDERIDVQAVIGTPYTPEATSVLLSGADAQYFDVYSGGYLVFKAATRASVPRATTLTLTVAAVNANGFSDTCTLSVWVPATGLGANGEVFIDFGLGSDANTGAFGSSFKHCPGTGDYTGSAKTYTSGQTLFFAGDSLHKTYLGKSNLVAQGTPPMDNQAGASLAAPVRYAFHGWKGQAKFSGARDENGAVTSASSAEAFASPSLANLKVQTVSTAIEWFQSVFWQDGGTMGFLAQYPRPTTLADRLRPYQAADGTNNYNGTTSDGGWKQITYTTNPADPAAVKLYYNGASSYIQDAALDAHFNNATIALNANGIGLWFMVWDSTNNVTIVNITSYDVTTHRATFSSPTLSTLSTFTSYALLNSPYDVQVQGQFSGSLSGLKIVSYPPASPGQVSVSREAWGAMISTNPNVSYHQLWCQGYSGGSNLRNGASTTTGGGGAAIASRNNTHANVPGISIYGCRSHNNCNGDESALGILSTGSEDIPAGPGGMYQWVIHRMHYSANWFGRGWDSTARTIGLETGSGAGGYPTKAEVSAYARNKYWWGYVEQFGATKSVHYLTHSRGLHFKENVVRDFNTVHGDYYAWYAESPTAFGDHNYVERDFGDNVLRWKTTSFDFGFLTAGVSNWYDGILVLADPFGGNTGLSLFSGDPGSTYTSCAFLVSTRSAAAASPIPCAAFNGGFANMTVQNSILNGATTSTASLGGVAPTFSYLNNGVTVTISAPTNWPTNNTGASQIVTGNTQLAVQQTWDGVSVPAGWVTILRAGAGSVRLGPFLTV